MLQTGWPCRAISLCGARWVLNTSGFFHLECNGARTLLCTHRGGWGLRTCAGTLSSEPHQRNDASPALEHNEHEGLDQAIDATKLVLARKSKGHPVRSLRDAPGMLPAPLARMRLGKGVEHLRRLLPNLFHPAAALPSRQI